ncbi:MAG: hypothetical protein H6646_04115 [Anaerolineales bacterium]|nr:hypothetical protein [Anaerolineales bacterium]MCO5245326.1 hypothetical protein [Anaerolineae bacterium]
MSLDDMSRRANDPRYISGIYNYCDSWCERCAFTDRCLNFAMRIEFEELAEEARAEREAEDSLAELLDPLDIIEELDSPADANEDAQTADQHDWEMDEFMAEEERISERASTHPLVQAAEAYIGMANDWFEFGHGQERLASGPHYLISPEPAVEGLETQSQEIRDAIDVIRWYLFFISVKLQRALRGLESEARDPDFGDDMPKDSDGTAKITLIAIDRSTGAWATLMNAYPERRTTTLPILALLARLRHDLEVEFPAAWAFIRPGFDEIDDAQD